MTCPAFCAILSTQSKGCMKYREIPVPMYYGTEYNGPYLIYAPKWRKWNKYNGSMRFIDIDQRIMIPKKSLELLDLVGVE